MVHASLSRNCQLVQLHTFITITASDCAWISWFVTFFRHVPLLSKKRKQINFNSTLCLQRFQLPKREVASWTYPQFRHALLPPPPWGQSFAKCPTVGGSCTVNIVSVKGYGFLFLGFVSHPTFTAPFTFDPFCRSGLSTVRRLMARLTTRKQIVSAYFLFRSKTVVVQEVVLKLTRSYGMQICPCVFQYNRELGARFPGN